MKELLFYAMCYYSGLIHFMRWLRSRSGKHVIILNYHRASGGNLRRHMLYLRRYYRVLPLESALRELYSPRELKGRIKDRRTLLVLTFDDGYRDNYTDAFPLACALQVPLTIFLVPGYIEEREHTYYWWVAGEYLVEHTQVEETVIEGRTYQLSQPADRDALAQTIYKRARDARSVAEREAFLMQVRQALALSSIVPVEKEAILSWEEIAEMGHSGWVSFGGHTMHHPVLGYLADPAEVRSEVHECRTVIGQHLGHPVHVFAYPIGKAEHIGPDAVQEVRAAGYKWAVTTIYGFNTSKSDLFQLRRIEVDVKKHWLLIAADTAGLRHFCSPLLASGNRLLAGGRTRINLFITFLKSTKITGAKQ